ncbi:SIR2 family protein [Rhizobium sp. BK538]|uniref:SIR2 family protein n=1 Tax=Rhizobium sp. BK538 TaxID=2586984 RepID=UPI0017BC7F64|nr:SIR2 family protein [Rhizobium sp. BK538]MBB4170792.1 hypothetical protein [Rhizobium sp. BK538]
MKALSKYLNASVKAEGPDEEEKWSQVSKALESGQHLEGALEGVNLPLGLLRKIVASTWKCVNEKDADLYCKLYTDPFAYPLGELLEALFRSNANTIDVITTNYDRVVEYACNSAGLLFQTGFAPGYLQKWENGDKITFRNGHKESRVVKIWKVHGSLDWFQTADERVVGLPVFSLPDSGVSPLIVTPGLNKYEKTSEDPFRTTINGADSALKRAAAFLCIGFGFRDKHIHPKIIERCREKNVPIVVLAQELTEEAKSFLRSKAGNNFLGIEQAGDGSRIFTAEFPEGVTVASPKLWSMNGFNKLVF